MNTTLHTFRCKQKTYICSSSNCSGTSSTLTGDAVSCDCYRERVAEYKTPTYLLTYVKLCQSKHDDEIISLPSGATTLALSELIAVTKFGRRLLNNEPLNTGWVKKYCDFLQICRHISQTMQIRVTAYNRPTVKQCNPQMSRLDLDYRRSEFKGSDITAIAMRHSFWQRQLHSVAVF